MTLIHPFILSGGSGTRLWPLSRKAYPKQFLALTGGNKSLFQMSCERFAAPEFAPPVILGGNDHRFIIAEQLREIDITPASIVLEPMGRNTAPAAALAALIAAETGEDALLLLAPSDHVIADPAAFRATMMQGVPAAKDGALITFGVKPSGPHTGYGYIEVVEGEGAARPVKRFVEKPNQADAAAYVASGNFYWNAGIFLMSARTLLAAFEAHAPEILEGCKRALLRSGVDLDFVRLDAQVYAAVPDISIDYAIMEKARNVVCIPLTGQWSDLGAWPAVWEVIDKDANSNAAHGDVIFHDTKGSYAYSENACVAVVGLEDVLVVATKDAILVASKEHAQSVKNVVDQLKTANRPEVEFHKRVYRPWGWFEGLDRGDRFQVKRIMVKPGAQLSLQSHYHRAEHWIVVEGTLEVTIDNQVQLLNENQSTYIPLGARHRLANPGRIPAFLIEVQSGSYLGEDDIVRYEDIYGRAAE
jgi:mannose-1-phosphate guanylyltransferase / mannose-6-phosphate isomerase